MNWILIAGNLGDDPEERFTPGGQKVITLRIATRSRRKGEDVTTWFRVTIWGDRFDKMLPYFKKGSAIIVGGELQKPEIYTDREGKPQISLEIYAETIRFSPFGRSDRAGAGAATPAAAVQASSVYVQPAAQLDEMTAAASMDDNLPF
jgi:single-strand DNA-binding protein